MARVLIAWELGANFGHLTRQLPIARCLRDAGHEVLFAVRDTASAQSVLTPAGFRFVQAPVNLGRPRLARAAASYSELLLAEGYGDAGSLYGRVLAWRNLFGMFRPQAVIVDHSPTALLAARTARLVAIPVGNGFEIPPRVSPLPNIGWHAVTVEHLQRTDDAVCRVMNECLRRFSGAASVERVSDLFPETHVLATFAELDHYGQRDGDTYFGPLFSSVTSARVEWQSTQRPRVLAYLRNGSAGLKNLLASLKGIDAEVVCVLPGIGRGVSRTLSDGAFRVLAHGVDLESMVGDASFVVHSGSGTAAQSLLAGVPVFTMPSNLEQYVHAKRVEALGAGITIGTERTRTDLDGALARMMSERGYKERAAEFAARHAGFTPTSVAERAATLVERSLRPSTDLH